MNLLNGEISESPGLSDAILLGDGVFETLRSYGGKLFAVAEHFERLERGLIEVGGSLAAYPWYGREVILAGVEKILSHDAIPSGALRISIYSDGNWILTHKSYSPSAQALRCTLMRRDHEALTFKSSSYSMRLRARRLAERSGFDDAIFVDSEGEISELSTSNLIALIDGELITPRLESGALPGVTRKLLIENFGLVERALTVETLARAESIAAISSLREIQPIKEIDGKDTPTSNRLRELQESFHSWILGNLAL